MDHVQLIYDIGELSGIFATSASIETILQKIVEMVAKHMKADVCSIYLYNEEKEELILKATKGLNPDSIDNVRLKLGEGIAGFALKGPMPICERIGSEHPKYKFFPGIFEERYEAFLAVPILRGITKIGVLIVQREKKVCFKKHDILAMRAVSSQLAAIIENARLLMKLNPRIQKTTYHDPLKDKKLIKAKVASEGFAYSDATVLDNEKAFDLLLNMTFDREFTMEDFENALRLSETQLEVLQEQVEEKLSDVASLIFTAHLMILKDKGFVGKMKSLIMEGESPPLVVRNVAREYIDMFSQNPSPYIREKVQDIKDLVLRIMRNLVSGSKEIGDCKEKVVVAGDLFPSDILKLSSERVKGIILVTGGVTSHLSILARSLQIPLVIAENSSLLEIPENTKILLDAEVGNIYINPSDEIVARFRERNEARLKLIDHKRLMHPNAKTRDGKEIRLMANINLLTDLKLACELQADGIGLYRSEFPFLIRSDFPTEEEQFVVYHKLIEGMPEKEITFRTLDIGGDKVLSYYQNTKEQNPFLGMRSIRFSLQNKDIFKQQIRAMLRAGARARIKIMFPMISSLDEFLEAKGTILNCVKELQREGIDHNKRPQVGMMIEIPSVIDIIDDFAREADFFSIGTNDFVQYMLAVDRTNEKVALLYLPYHPSILRSIKKVADTANANEIEVSVCGDMAHDEGLIPFLLGIGIRIFSLEPMYLPKIRKVISGIGLNEAKRLSDRLLKESKVDSIAKIIFKKRK
ncbi:MAG: phosphoenolpyruvate--protein phosphotransferase [bacterium]